jgi:chemotaxis protein CheC
MKQMFLLRKGDGILDLDKLNQIQLDTLLEIGNIGAGNAATALSELINERIDMTVPQIKILPFSELAGVVVGGDMVVAGIYLPITGSIPGEVLFTLPYAEAKVVAALMLKQESTSDELSEMECSALTEAGNILTGSFFNALSSMTSLTYVYSPPSFCIDFFEAIIGSILYRLGVNEDYALFIATEFSYRGKKLVGSFFYLPQSDSLDAILKAVGVDR